MAIFVLNNEVSNPSAAALALFFLSASALISCKMEVTVPVRLPSIPETAVWAGGLDGGAWMECLVDMEKDANWCTVWNDYSGTVRARTYFILSETGEPLPENEMIYASFDGYEIRLQDGRRLIPLEYYRADGEHISEPAPIDPERDHAQQSGTDNPPESMSDASKSTLNERKP